MRFSASAPLQGPRPHGAAVVVLAADALAAAEGAGAKMQHRLPAGDGRDRPAQAVPGAAVEEGRVLRPGGDGTAEGCGPRAAAGGGRGRQGPKAMSRHWSAPCTSRWRRTASCVGSCPRAPTWHCTRNRAPPTPNNRCSPALCDLPSRPIRPRRAALSSPSETAAPTRRPGSLARLR